MSNNEIEKTNDEILQAEYISVVENMLGNTKKGTLYDYAKQFFLKISITYTLDINRKIFYLFILFLILGTFYGIFGLLRNNPGALITTKEIVFYPFLFFIFINQVTNIKTW